MIACIFRRPAGQLGVPARETCLYHSNYVVTRYQHFSLESWKNLR